MQVPPLRDGKTCPALPKHSHGVLPEQSVWLQAGKARLSALHRAGREGGQAQRPTKLLCGV